ncbi:MAG: hypothetical protein A2942_03585 [Candidatus Lloydbacteria bacterium RIFCSPLOWO2_01_FULL_50_20]|uniref:Uncharacterized protein n=1 Tax=Candidatus Lloydbacteria bacterium RIFCSPLOWO2_01_FULL_50_20 TaxID=1798665 RepID=A0A1G2DHC2_9BACT|nr:MAG: hypothetical protein A3C13_02775 [Candidatus Lloydbacteria bacterium RIFCSPHIGHO2_02_FULL_50_11]OGZ12822.1 MAG: hypothetical protein A2942_03585 [Candidatus Lloydbacteria bacterium RIFCSPLOWO2_01_FULL_50_20]
MSDYFSRDATETPFQHRISDDFRDLLSIDHIYAEEHEGRTRILKEHECRGDAVGYLATELMDVLRPGGAYHPHVWSLSLSAKSHESCLVFGPPGFAIGDFRHDLALLNALGVMGSFCGRMDYLSWHGEYARLLSGNSSWGSTQGWWHKHKGVIVVCSVQEGANRLLKTILALLKIPRQKIIQLDVDFLLVERIFEEAVAILLGEAKKISEERTRICALKMK